MKVLVTDSVEDQAIEILRKDGLDVDVRLGLSAEAVRSAIGDYDALVVRSGTKVTSEILNAGLKLKVVGRAGTGVDNIDVDAATRKGIIVLNAPGGNTVSTAEHSISMMLALARNIPQAHQSVKAGKWERSKFVGTELCGKTLGIVGLGKVGKEVAVRSLGFQMKVIAFDPITSADVARALGVELVDFDELLRRSDFISVHSPLTNETKGLFGVKAFSKCKPGVRIINCARGGIVSEKDLQQAIDKGIVAGAALDVFESEPVGNNPILAYPNVIVTPHLGASTEEAQEKVAVQIAGQVADALLGRGIVGSVNADVISSSLNPDLQPYLILSEKLGKLVAQLAKGKITSLTIRTTGTLLNTSNQALGASVLKGILTMLLDEPVNYLNAPVIARERGIGVNVHQEADHDLYTHVVSVEYQSDAEKRSLAGTVFGSRSIRIVEVDGFHVELRPEGNLLFYSNVDKPGMLAGVGTVLARAQVNIAGLSLGRFKSGEEALTVMNLDSQLSEETISKIIEIQGISGVKQVFL